VCTLTAEDGRPSQDYLRERQIHTKTQCEKQDGHSRQAGQPITGVAWLQNFYAAEIEAACVQKLSSCFAKLHAGLERRQA
jgi:hypothetical protein